MFAHEDTRVYPTLVLGVPFFPLERGADNFGIPHRKVGSAFCRAGADSE